jgi:NAD(P)-dependent dehydrogenase (short-subunit alcohol dehydrogenase family)
MGTDAPRLKGRVALIAGGTEGVGEGIVRAFLRLGAVVVVPSTSAQELERLRDALQDVPTDDLVTIFGDVRQFGDAERIREVLLRRVGRLDAVIASPCPWCPGQDLPRASLETWDRALRDHVTAHVVVIHTFLPLLVTQRHGSYTMLRRTDAEGSFAGVGTSAITRSIQELLVRLLVEELPHSQVRINEVTIYPASTHDRGDDAFATCVGTFTAWLALEEGASVRGAVIRQVPDGQRPNGGV